MLNWPVAWLMVAAAVLRASPIPLSTGEIWAKAQRLYKCPRAGKTPERSLSSALTRALFSDNPLKFVKTGHQFTVKK